MNPRGPRASPSPGGADSRDDGFGHALSGGPAHIVRPLASSTLTQMIHAKRKAGHAILHFVQTTQRPISTSALKIKANRGRLLEAEVSSCETGEKISPSGAGVYARLAAHSHFAPGKPCAIQSVDLMPGGGFTHSAAKRSMSTSRTILASGSHFDRPAAFDWMA